MSLAMTLAATPFAFVSSADSALSEEANALGVMIEEVSAFHESVTVRDAGREAQARLNLIYARARKQGWDGEDVLPVEPSTYAHASRFLRLLPDHAPVPEIAADRDGEILVEWDLGPRRILSVSVARDGTLNFAGLFGHSKTHGAEHFGEALPVVVADSLDRVVAKAGANGSA